MLKTISKYIVVLALVVLAAVAGIFWGKKMEVFKTHEIESSELMLERVSKVFKMIAVEGYVSEVYDYKQYKYWDINFLRKKALVRVKAKVSIGYDFEKATFKIDEENKAINVLNFPEPEILSIDHDLDYFDMDEGLFNTFDEKELTKLNTKAKEYALEMIKSGELFDEAESQKDNILSMMETMFGSSGWKLVVKEKKRFIKG